MYRKLFGINLFIVLTLLALTGLTGCNGKTEYADNGDTVTYSHGNSAITYAKAGVIDEYYVVGGGVNLMEKDQNKFAAAVLSGIPLERAKILRKKYPKLFVNGGDIMGKQETRLAVMELALIYDPALKDALAPKFNAIQKAYASGARECVRITGELLTFQSGLYDGKYEAKEPRSGSRDLKFVLLKEIEIIGDNW